MNWMLPFSLGFYIMVQNQKIKMPLAFSGSVKENDPLQECYTIILPTGFIHGFSPHFLMGFSHFVIVFCG